MRVSKEEEERRLAFCADAMVRLRSTYAVEVACHNKFGVNKRTVTDWIAKVRRARRAEQGEVNRDAARDAARADFNLVAAMALARTEVVKDADGKVVLDQRPTLPDGAGTRPNPRYLLPLERPRPDLQRAHHAFRELAHLDALYEPVKGELKIEAPDAALAELGLIGAESVEALEKFVKTLSPNGELDGLAGEWFKFSGARVTRTAPPPAPTPIAVADPPAGGEQP